jgi:hypothetical protein
MKPRSSGVPRTKPHRAEGEKILRNISFGRGVITCEVCGNEYDKPLEIVHNGISHYFDCFECAIQALAPQCAHCQCKIIGHGVEAGGTMFCCAHCAAEKGVTSLKDRS